MGEINYEENSPFTPGNIITDLEVRTRKQRRVTEGRTWTKESPSVGGRSPFCHLRHWERDSGNKASGMTV